MKLFFIILKILRKLSPSWRSAKKLERVKRSLERAYLKKLQMREALKKEIEDQIELQVSKKKSKYIPAKIKRMVLEAVYEQYGERMRELDLYLKPNLEWSE